METQNIEQILWSPWRSFPDPRKGDILRAPYGMGLYQLKNLKNQELILFGKGNNCAYRMSSLLPKPYGQGTRNNSSKREYLLKNIENIEYRTAAFTLETDMLQIEKLIKNQKNHLFNT